MRGSVMGSVVVHLALIAVLLALRAPTPVMVPGPEVVQVALISPETPAVSIPRPPQPVHPHEAPTVAPEKGEGVRLAPPKPTPPPKREPPKQEPPALAPALPWAQVGPAGLKGQVAVDAHDFEFTYYLMLVRNRIAQNWTPPAGLEAGGSIQAVAYFQIGREGGLRGVRLETSSGLEYFDRSVTRAVMLSDPLPPLPLGFTGPTLGVHFGFQWGSP
jgi:protein TonB